MFEYLNPEGQAFLNGEDDKLSTVKAVNGKTPVRFGLEEKDDVYASEIEENGILGSSASIHLSGNNTIQVNIPLPGIHSVINACAGAAVGEYLGLTAEEIKSGIESVKTIAGRNNLIRTDSLIIIDDCYNANPVSMKASLDVLKKAFSRRVAILGDMFELGENETAMHEETGAYAAECADVLLSVGPLSEHMHSGAVNAGMKKALHFDTKEELMKQLPALLAKGDTVLVKATHGMALEQVVAFLQKLDL